MPGMSLRTLLLAALVLVSGINDARGIGAAGVPHEPGLGAGGHPVSDRHRRDCQMYGVKTRPVSVSLPRLARSLRSNWD